MNVGAVIARHLTGTYTVTRTANRTSTYGRLDAASTSTFSIDAHVQPIDGRAIDSLPEGKVAGEARTVWTTTELRASGASEADKVSIDGDTYEVQAVEKWADRGATYYRAVVVLTRGAS